MTEVRRQRSTNAKRNFMSRKLIALSALLFPLWFSAHAQQPGKAPRIGYLGAGGGPRTGPTGQAFLQGLRDLGYVEGRNILIEYRSAEGKSDRLPDLAAELVRLKVSVIFASATLPAKVVKQATDTIPIIFAGVADPIAAGLVTSLARPGGNITGLSTMSIELAAKRLELLNEAFPRVSRVTFLYNPDEQPNVLILGELKRVAPELRVRLQPRGVKNPNDLERTFSEIIRARDEALLTGGGSFILSHQKQIVEFAVKNRLPALFYFGEFAEGGGLMSYGPDLPDQYRRAAKYVDKILKGAKPADLPVEQPTKFELVINLKTAKQIGLTIPETVLFRADKVIR